MDCYGKYYYQDGLIYVNGNDSLLPPGERVFYEVIRTYGGVPFFFDDHFERLVHGISGYYEVPGNLRDTIIEGLNSLMQSDLIPEINVRVTVAFNNDKHNLHICYISSFYPTEEMYSEGVRLILLDAERTEPELKLLNNELRYFVGQELERKNAYEALLVNSNGVITEGSRSNIFFLSGNETVFTAPDSMVLNGITRKYLLKICEEENIKVVFEPVAVKSLSEFKAAFISGTSPMIMPVKSIGDNSYSTDIPLIARLRSRYQTMAEESVRKFLLE